MSEKPNPSLDCASLVRFSALPLYHGGELQSCCAVIRSSSLLQTPPPSPLCPPPTPPQLLLTTNPPTTPPPPLWTIKEREREKMCLYSSHSGLGICLVGEVSRKSGRSFRGKTQQRNRPENLAGAAAGMSAGVIKRGARERTGLAWPQRRLSGIIFWSLRASDAYLSSYWGHRCFQTR